MNFFQKIKKDRKMQPKSKNISPANAELFEYFI